VAAPATDSLDDVTPNGDQTATSGTLVVGAGGVSWTGNIPVGVMVTVTGTVTVKNPDTGNRSIVARVQTTAPGSNCPAASSDPNCFFTLPVSLPGLSVVTTASGPTTTPGSTVTFTVTISDSGETAYVGAQVSIPLSGLDGDADYAGDATAPSGTVTSAGADAAQVLTWTGNLAVGAAVTVTYSVVVKNPDPGGKVLAARVSSTEVGSSCPPGSGNAGCGVTVVVLTPDLTIAHTAGSTSAVAGATVTFTITIRNTGQTPYTGLTVTESLAGMLDDATYNGDAATGTGTLTYLAPTLTWTGTLAPGATATVTYSMTVATGGTGDGTLAGTVVAAATGSNCPIGGADPDCTATVTVTEVTFLNTADRTSAAPTDVVRYTVVISNTGATALTGISADDIFIGALDDAGYNGDATASSGTLVLVTGTGRVVWTGDLPVGATVTVTGSLTVHNPDTGNKVMSTLVTSGAPGNNCPVGGSDPRCTASVQVLTPGLSITKTADAGTATPGGRVGYTIAVVNTGTTTYAGAVVTDDLAGVLTDATYAGNAAATTGTVTVTGSTLRWVGDVGLAGTVTITYSMTVRSPDPGDKRMVNTATSEALGSSCPDAAPGAACTATVLVLVPALTVVKTADVATATPGDRVAYTIVATNSGQTPYTGIAVTDLLTGVLDDAGYDGNATADAGAVSVTGATLTWTGGLAIGAAVTITYSVTVAAPGGGDGRLVNAVTSPAAGSTCPAGGTDARCTTTVAVLVPGLTFATTADVASTSPGGRVRFTVTATNSGGTPYPGLSFTSSLAAVLDDATFDNNAAATSGAVDYSAPALTWTGDLAVGASVTVTFTVLVRSPDPGDRSLVDLVTSAARGSGCPPAGTAAACRATVAVLLPGLGMSLVADRATTTPAGTVGYTLTVTNTGQTGYPAVTVTVPLTGVLDDATRNGDESATAGTVSYAAGVLSWTGALPPAGSVQVTFSVTVASPDLGDKTLVATAGSDAAGSGCPIGAPTPSCRSSVAVLIPALTVVATADRTQVIAGDAVHYTVTVTNSGQTPYAGITVRTDLAGALDDGDYAGGTTDAGTVAYAAPVLTWTGDLAVGATATITYTVDVGLPATGDRAVTAVATSAAAGSGCPAPGTAAGCTVTVAVLVPALTITKTALAAGVVSGDRLGYRIVVANTGQSAYPAASFTDSLVGVLDDASYGADADATSGTVSFAGNTLTWVGSSLPAGGSATITYSVVTHLVPGDRSLVNVVTSDSPGSNCPTGSTAAGCATDTLVTPQSLTLTDLTDSFGLTGVPGDRVERTGAVTMTVTTNSAGGYAVTVQPASAELRPETGSPNTDSIPISELEMRRNGEANFVPMSTGPVLVHAQDRPSAPGGDAVSSDYAMTVPFVRPDTYSTVLDYIAVTQ
jgi:large repetitive protein